MVGREDPAVAWRSLNKPVIFSNPSNYPNGVRIEVRAVRWLVKCSIKKIPYWASLVVQWIKNHLPVKGILV